MVSSIRFYKKCSSDRIWWVNNPEYVGWLESFDRKGIYSLYKDYLKNLFSSKGTEMHLAEL